jgi:hypothetical protein
MKNLANKFLAVMLMTAGAGLTFGQVRIVNSNANSAAANSSAFIDASSNNTTNPTGNIGKGLLFPRTDLTAFTSFSFASTTGIPTNYPTRFDGMIVYNTATGGVAGVGATSEPLFPGFWYYENKSTTSVTGGTWKPIVSAVPPKVNVVAAETATNTALNGSTVYARKGQFTTNGTSTSPTSYTPAGGFPIAASATAGLYRITIYKTNAATGVKTVFADGVYSYDTSNGTFITGSPSMSVVYPLDTYDYVVEYTK